MSRREDEFRHRTSVFEGAYRAWSHLGGLDPDVLESKSAKELDPIDFPLINDTRGSSRNSRTREYPYEPLPRSGLSHPFVKAVLSPWLGANADNDAVELGLGTLRTWWQHRRKGESKTAQKALHTDKMQEVVNTYTRHFFELAHCLVVTDNAQPPRTLYTKLKKSEKQKSNNSPIGGNNNMSEESVLKVQQMLTDKNLSPLEKIHAAQKQQFGDFSLETTTTPVVNVRGKCLPGNIDLPGMVDAVKQKATQLAHRGGKATAAGVVAPSISPVPTEDHGDPTTTPIVFQNARDSELTIMLDVGGITCAHCVKIVETVLRGCRGDKSPISGLLDAAADKDLSSVLIKINKASNAKRIAFEAARNLSLVGYNARPKEIQIPEKMDREAMNNIFLKMAKKYPMHYVAWDSPCTCPDHGVFRKDCDRHVQMGKDMYDKFDLQQQRIMDFVYPKQEGGGSITAGSTMDAEFVPHVSLESEVSYEPNQVNTYQGIVPPEMRQFEPAQPRFSFMEAPLNIEQPMLLDGIPDYEDPGNPEETNIEPLPLTDPVPITNEYHRRRSTRGVQRGFSGLSALSIDWEAFHQELDGEMGMLDQPNEENRPVGVQMNYHEQSAAEPYAI